MGKPSTCHPNRRPRYSIGPSRLLAQSRLAAQFGGARFRAKAKPASITDLGAEPPGGSKWPKAAGPLRSSRPEQADVAVRTVVDSVAEVISPQCFRARSAGC